MWVSYNFEAPFDYNSRNKISIFLMSWYYPLKVLLIEMLILTWNKQTKFKKIVICPLPKCVDNATPLPPEVGENLRDSKAS